MHGFDLSIPLFITCICGMHIVVTPEIVSNVLHVPKVEHPDYPDCDRLKTMSKGELIYAFCECHSDWGEHQFTYLRALLKTLSF